ncbi:MAG: response regulator [Spirochaetaceae bacterium]|jgi:two-component system alkaline phosphatase synthesis response regulator PhoP|nr:response regulator [Spirochaetaceae bacterium]
MDSGERETLLIIEDEADIRELIAFNLDLCGYEVLKSADGQEGLDLALGHKPDLILLDLMLPGMDGFEVCRQIRKHPEIAQCPIIMLTARSEDENMIKGLELGADDYITKPFSPQVLVARVKAILRRRGDLKKKSPTGKIIQARDITIDIPRHEVRIGNKRIELSATEFTILQFLAENRGWVFSRNQIIDAIKGEDYPVTARSIDVQIVGLRKKLGDHGPYIETVRGVGYRFSGE